MNKKILFICVHNSARSQMAEAWFNKVCRDGWEAKSAGLEPGVLNPIVIKAMHEVGIDLSQQHPRQLTTDLARGAAILITMGCGDECPVVPGVSRDDWPLSDPKDRPIAEVRAIRDDIKERVRALIHEKQWQRRS